METISRFYKVIICALIVAGALIRFLSPSDWLTFDYDQEVLWTAAHKVVTEGKLTLIGQEMSIGGIFMGPLVVYSLVPVVFVSSGNPQGMIVWVVVVYLVTSAAYFWVASSWFGRTAALCTLALYAFSPSLILYDRLLAPSTLLLAHALVLLYGIDAIVQGKQRGFLIAGVGLGIGMHITFVWLFALILVAFVLVRQRKLLTYSKIAALLVPWMLFLLPLILFEFRHEFLTVKRLGSFFFEQSAAIHVPSRLLLLSSIALTEAGRVVTTTYPLSVGITAWVLIVFVWARMYATQSSRMLLIGSWLLLPSFLLLLYPRHIPEYYLTPATALYPVLLGAAFSLLLKLKHGLILVGFVLLFTAVNGAREISVYKNPFSLSVKQEAVAHIIEHVRTRPYRIDFVAHRGLVTGFTFLFSQARSKPVSDPTVPPYTLVLPVTDFDQRGIHRQFGLIGIQYPKEYGT